MRINSKLSSNLGLSFGSLSVTLPALATLELDDTVYEDFIPALTKRVEAGQLEFLKKPTLSKEKQAIADAKALAAAKKLIASQTKEAK